jgi:hypothetical protein
MHLECKHSYKGEWQTNITFRTVDVCALLGIDRIELARSKFNIPVKCERIGPGRFMLIANPPATVCGTYALSWVANTNARLWVHLSEPDLDGLLVDHRYPISYIVWSKGVLLCNVLQEGVPIQRRKTRSQFPRAFSRIVLHWMQKHPGAHRVRDVAEALTPNATPKQVQRVGQRMFSLTRNGHLEKVAFGIYRAAPRKKGEVQQIIT